MTISWMMTTRLGHRTLSQKKRHRRNNGSPFLAVPHRTRSQTLPKHRNCRSFCGNCRSHWTWRRKRYRQRRCPSPSSNDRNPVFQSGCRRQPFPQKEGQHSILIRRCGSMDMGGPSMCLSDPGPYGCRAYIPAGPSKSIAGILNTGGFPAAPLLQKRNGRN